jgi:triacylglycerol esterase/lipase EstA (alpha/beta hydrolase family)
MKKQLAISAITLACLAPIAQNAAAADPAGYTKTKYPIVLVHGIFGFDTFQGAPYFYGIETHSSKTRVAPPPTSPPWPQPAATRPVVCSCTTT